MDTADYTLYRKGVTPGTKRERGVGIAISNKITLYITQESIDTNDRIMYMRIHLPHSEEIAVISTYASTLKRSDSDKDQFYENLQNQMKFT